MASTTVPHPIRRRLPRAVRLLLGVLGLYLIGRAIAEPFVIDLGDPATYRADWGGPSLAGVLAVHCGAGAAALLLGALDVRRGLRSAR